MLQNDLSLISIEKSFPEYNEKIIRSYVESKAKSITIDKFNHDISQFKCFTPFPINFTIDNVIMYMNAAIKPVNDKQKQSYKIFSVIPRLYSLFEPTSEEIQKIICHLIFIKNQFPAEKFHIIPLAAAYIYNFTTVPYNISDLLSLSIVQAKLINEIFTNSASSIEQKIFIISLFIPSVCFFKITKSLPKDYYLLPDPIYLAKQPQYHTNSVFSYASHTIMLCNRFIYSFSDEEHEIKFEDTLLLTTLLGAGYFSKSCLMTSLSLTTISPNTSIIFSNFIQKLKKMNCPALFEEIILYNTTASFASLIPFLGNYLYDYFIEEYSRFSEQAQYILNVFSYDFYWVSDQLKDITPEKGNKCYLYWLYIYFTRFNSLVINEQNEITKYHFQDMMKHIRTITLLIQSAEKFFDPQIDQLLLILFRSILPFISTILISQSSTNNILTITFFEFIVKVLHYIISCPTTLTYNPISIRLLDIYLIISNILTKNSDNFRSLTFLEPKHTMLPIYAIIFANIKIPIRNLSRIIRFLIVSDEPIYFYCAVELITHYELDFQAIELLIQNFLTFLYQVDKKDHSYKIRQIVRSLLILSIAFQKHILGLKTMEGIFPVFYESLNNLIEHSIKKKYISILESIILCLSSFYRFNSDVNFLPFKIEVLYWLFKSYKIEIRIELMNLTIKWCMVHNIKQCNLYFENNTFDRIPNDVYANFANFIKRYNPKFDETKMRSDTKDQTLVKNIPFNLPWKRSMVFSHLIDESFTNKIVFERIENTVNIN